MPIYQPTWKLVLLCFCHLNSAFCPSCCPEFTYQMIINFLFLVIALRFWKALEMSKSCNFSLRKLQYNCTRCINWIMEIGTNKTNCWFILYSCWMMPVIFSQLGPQVKLWLLLNNPSLCNIPPGKRCNQLPWQAVQPQCHHINGKKIYILVKPPGTRCWHYPHAVTVPSTKLFNCCLCKLCVL